MKSKLLTIALLTLQMIAFGQVSQTKGGILSQEYSKSITEYRVKEFIIREILQLSEKQVVEVEINAITASSSGELTTVIYECRSLNKRVLIFGFWSEEINEFNIKYNGYTFKNFDFEESQSLLNELEKVLEAKKSILNYGDEDVLIKNVVYKYDDFIFDFYRGDIGANLIRVFWNGFDSEWNQSNLKTMNRRFKKYFNRPLA